MYRSQNSIKFKNRFFSMIADNQSLLIRHVLVGQDAVDASYAKKMQQIATQQIKSLNMDPFHEKKKEEEVPDYKETHVVYGLLTFKEFDKKQEEKTNKEEQKPAFLEKITKREENVSKSTLAIAPPKAAKQVVARKVKLRASYNKHLTFLF